MTVRSARVALIDDRSRYNSSGNIAFALEGGTVS